MNEEYVKAYIAAINAELQAKVLEIISLKAQHQMLKDVNRQQEEAIIAHSAELQQLTQVVNTTEDTYGTEAIQEPKKTSGKKKIKI